MGMRYNEYRCMPQPISSGRPLRLGCTRMQHDMIGKIDAIVNARGGDLWRNDLDRIYEIELHREARAYRDWQTKRVRPPRFTTRALRHLNAEFGYD